MTPASPFNEAQSIISGDPSLTLDETGHEDERVDRVKEEEVNFEGRRFGKRRRFGCDEESWGLWVLAWMLGGYKQYRMLTASVNLLVDFILELAVG